MKIRDVTARYANATNRGFAGREIDWAELERVYTEDAQWHSADLNMHAHGREAVIDSLREAEPTVTKAVHSFTNPVIELDGDAATGQWVMPIGSVHDGQLRSVFMGADFPYLRTPTGWRINRADVSFALMPAIDAPTPLKRDTPTRKLHPGGVAA